MICNPIILKPQVFSCDSGTRWCPSFAGCKSGLRFAKIVTAIWFHQMQGVRVQGSGFTNAFLLFDTQNNFLYDSVIKKTTWGICLNLE
jgi:hypothetical protein